MIHDSQHVIVRQSFPTHGHHRDISLSGIKLAHIVILTKVTLIWIILLGYDSKERCINVGKRLNGTTATSSSSTFEGIWSTTKIKLFKDNYIGFYMGRRSVGMYMLYDTRSRKWTKFFLVKHWGPKPPGNPSDLIFALYGGLWGPFFKKP